jgi:hypothetical protein
MNGAGKAPSDVARSDDGKGKVANASPLKYINAWAVPYLLWRPVLTPRNMKTVDVQQHDRLKTLQNKGENLFHCQQTTRDCSIFSCSN